MSQLSFNFNTENQEKTEMMNNLRTIEIVKAEIKEIKAEKVKAIKSLKRGNASAFQKIIDLKDELVFLFDELAELED